MSYKTAQRVNYLGDNKFEITTWRGNLSAFSKYIVEMNFDPIDCETLIKQVKTEPVGPIKWDVTGPMYLMLKSKTLPDDYANQMKYIWEKSAYASAQIAESLYMQAGIAINIITALLNPYTSVKFTVKCSGRDIEDLLRDGRGDIAYIGELMQASVELAQE